MRGVVASAALLLSCAVAVLAAGALVDPVLPATFTPGPVPPLNAPPNGYFAEVPVAFFPAGAAVSSFTYDPCNGWFWTVMEHAAGGTVEAVSLMRVVPPPPSASSLPQGAKAQYAAATISLGGGPAVSRVPVAPFPASNGPPSARYNVAPLRMVIEKSATENVCEYWLAASSANRSSLALYSCNAPGAQLSLSCVPVATLAPTTGLRAFNDRSIHTTAKATGITSIAVTSKRVVVGTSQGVFVYTKGQAGVVTVTPIPLHVTNDETVLSSNLLVPSVGCVESWDRCFLVGHQDIPYPNTNNTDLVHAFRLSTFSFVHFYRVPGIIDGTPLSIVYDSVFDQVQFVNRQAINVMTRYGQLTRLGGWLGGVPQQACIGGVSLPPVRFQLQGPTFHMTFYGTDGNGAMVRTVATDGVSPSDEEKEVVALNATWSYFYGPRWMPASGNTFVDGSNNIVAMSAGIFANGNDQFVSGVFATANGGLSFTSGGFVPLALKAAEAQDVMKRHWRLNVTASLSLSIFGNPIQGAVAENGTANDGLWTSIYVSSETYHYATLKKEFAAAVEANAAQGTLDSLRSEMEVVRDNAWRAFSGMKELVTVTGTPGYPARSLRPFNTARDGPIPHGWYASPTMPGYIFLSDTSSDEIVGHLHMGPIVHSLLAETEAEREAVRTHHFQILDYILWGNLTLIDPTTGKATHWGHWEPASINFSPFFYDGRGVNSNAILCYLVGGYAMSNGAKTNYRDAFYDLVDNHGYAENMVNLKITQPSDVNYSDDELTYLPYLASVVSAQMANGSPNPLVTYMQRQLQLSLQRTTRFVAKVKCPYWNFVYLRSLEVFPASPLPLDRTSLLRDGLWTLSTFATSYVEWPIDNSNRLDAIPDNGPTRDGTLNILTHTLFPYNEISFVRWNSNPFVTTSGGGREAIEPTAYTAPYWIGRFYGYVQPNA